MVPKCPCGRVRAFDALVLSRVQLPYDCVRSLGRKTPSKVQGMLDRAAPQVVIRYVCLALRSTTCPASLTCMPRTPKEALCSSPCLELIFLGATPLDALNAATCQVVSGRRCVHTKLHTRQVTPPSRPRATVVCLRHQDRRTNHSDGDAGGGSAHGGHLVGTSPEKRAVAVERGHNEREQGLGGGLLFRLEIRWDGGGRSEGMGGTRGAARGAARDSSFARGQSPQVS